MSSFFSKIFNLKPDSEEQPDIKFGRYSDSYKTAAQYQEWDNALTAFEEEQYLKSYRSFFRFLKDKKEDNVHFWESDQGIEFHFFQGSIKVTGHANNIKFEAKSKIAHAQNLNIGFMRRMIEANYNLKYSRFALDPEQNIVIVFDTYTLDGSPYKLYYALKELATHADKHDDLLLDEFSELTPAKVEALKPISDYIKEQKYLFIKYKVEQVLSIIENGPLAPSEYPGAMAFLLLDLTYKLDYLTKPEGFMMESLERIHRLYFTTSEEDTINRNSKLIKEFQRLLKREPKDYYKEMYEVPATFGITAPVNHDKIVDLIENELHYMDWYEEHGHEEVALAIPSYIVGYCLFYYAIHIVQLIFN